MRLKESELQKSIQDQVKQEETPKNNSKKDNGKKQTVKETTAERIPTEEVVTESARINEPSETPVEEVVTESSSTDESGETQATPVEEVKVDIVTENPVPEVPTATVEQSTEAGSHTKVLDNLVKEVQIFSDDEDFMPPKKKGRVIVTIVIVLLIVALVVVGIVYVLPSFRKDKKDSNSSPTVPSVDVGYTYTYRDGMIVFQNGSTEIDSYRCVHPECSVYSEGKYQYHKNGVIAIQDGENIFLYNYLEKKEISENYTRLENLMRDGDTVSFIAEDANGKVGIIDVNGKVVLPFDYSNLAYSFGGGEVTDYSYEKNVITASKEGDWGLITLDNGTEKIPCQYDDIYYNGLEVVAVKDTGLWYLLDLQGNPVLEGGYDMIIPLESYLLVSQNNAFMILNYQGERVIQQDIPTYLKGFRGRLVKEVPCFKIEQDGTMVTIYIMESETDETLYDLYRFNTVNGELSAIIR